MPNKLTINLIQATIKVTVVVKFQFPPYFELTETRVVITSCGTFSNKTINILFILINSIDLYVILYCKDDKLYRLEDINSNNDKFNMLITYK